MKKTTKLLSVILAFVMALSCMTMMASAAKTKYQEVTDLQSLNAYSPYYTVTRLTTEERMSILADQLDILLASINIKLDPISVVGINLTIDFTSIDQLCVSISSFKSAWGNWLVGLLKGSLGSLKALKFDTWPSGTMSRDGTAQMTIVNEILELLSANTTLITNILTDGISLGLIGGFIDGLNLSPINNLVKDLPKLIKTLVLPLMGRQDDKAAQRNTLGNTGSDLITVAQSFVNGLFTKPMNWTSYREDASGNALGYTDTLPTAATGTSRYFVKSGNTITQYDYKYADAFGKVTPGYVETVTYTKDKEFASDDCTTYVYRAPDWYDGDQTLKWYKADGFVEPETGRIQSAYWSPVLKDAFENKGLTLNINGADSLVGLLYKFAPSVFEELAPTVLNGSAKKLIAEAFDVEFTKIGKRGDAAVQALAASTGDNFFTKAQEYYVWEYSDYKVINGTPYYRFQEEYFVGAIPSNISAYYSMFNWNWKVEGDFFNEFIPSTVGSTWVVDSLNNIVKKAIDTLIVDSWTVRGKSYTREGVFQWEAGGNDKLLTNLMNSARAFFLIAPEEIVDEYYAEAQFYDAMMNGTLSQAVNGLVCELVKLLMKQIKFSDDIVNQPITAILAVVVRELCTQLMPTYNFDAMIYTDYNTKAMVSHTADEWLDISLYMGVNLGMYYLRNIADVGEDDNTKGYYAVMKNLGALPASTADGMTFGANAYKFNGNTASWLAAVDWIVDWALDANTEWAWHFERLITLKEGGVASGAALTCNMQTYQNPFNKINAVLLNFFPDLNNLLNVSAFAGTDYGSGTLLEKILKDGLVDSIVTLNVPSLLSLLKVPSASILRSNNIADTLVQIVVHMLNQIFYKVAGSANLIQESSINSVAKLLNHANIRTVVVNLVGKLGAASATYNVLDPILPIANFFIGWTTDAQKYAEPQMYFSSSWGDNYLNKSAENTLDIHNASSGMLLKHRNSSTVDKAYIITVNSVATDGGSVAGCPVTIKPGETAKLAITTPAGEGVVKYTITYSVTGKDGAALGTTQTKILYAYYTEENDDENERIDGVDTGDYGYRGPYKRYNFTNDIYTTVDAYRVQFMFKQAKLETAFSTKKISYKSITAPDQSKDMNARAKKSFAYVTNQSEAGWPGTLYSPSQNTDPTAADGKIYKILSGKTSEWFNHASATANDLYGDNYMGQYAVKYGNKSGTWEMSFYFYNDFGIGDVMNKYVGYNIKPGDYNGTSEYAAYVTALKKVVELAEHQKKVSGNTEYKTHVQPNIETAITALDTAYDNLVATGSSSSSGVDTSAVKAKLNSIETLKDDHGFQKDINFQEYALHEYFEYEKQRTNARKMIKATTAPSAPENYIENGVWGNDLIAAIVAAQTDDDVKAGINNTVKTPSAEDNANYQQALADYKPAYYSNLDIADQTAKLQYYYNFMAANAKTTSIDFLTKEIAAAEAQNYDGTLYSEDSWSRYTAALAAAKAITSANKESEAFDAKYELMVAQNELKLKTRSMKEVRYMAEELLPLIDHANAIIANYGSLYNVKNGVTYADAFGQLVRALGVEYDVTIDGCRYDGILYDRSALTFKDYDRTSTAKNKAAVDVAADKLRAAIENFECTAKVEAATGTTTNVDQVVRYINNIIPNSLKNSDDLAAKVKVVGGATPVYTASKAGQYGTGARVDLKNGDTLLATYFVVIYGDVNGDGAVDAFDAIDVDLSNNHVGNDWYLGDVYTDAADINNDGLVNQADYSALVAGVQCQSAIAQSR